MTDKKSETNIERRAFLISSGLACTTLGLSSGVLPVMAETTQSGTEDEKKGPLYVNSGNAARTNPLVKLAADYIVVGGGIAGTCSAITAARAGLKVILVQDRPVLGGNASSEIRLWVLGATAHMGNNNRWSREGGVHEEIIVENLFRNREGNAVFFDALLLEKVWAEPNITLLLNTAVDNLVMDAPDHIEKVFAYCSQNSTRYELSAPMYCDTSGDGILGFLSGAAFRMGAESGEEFGEKFIMPPDYGSLLGHSMYFYSKDTGRPVKYVPPAFALKDIPKHVPRYKQIHRDSSGCPLWWLEWGDDLDRVFDSEKIKEELWKVVYGVWDYIKNSGTFENVDNLTLEWVSTIPGKRESRRFEGDYILKQQDIISQHPFEDAIAHGGWAIDLHPAKGVYSPYPGCTQYHSKGVYTIPYRSIYSRNISNLFFGGRLISVTHAAFGSTRVISTGTLCAQAAALAATLCLQHGLTPREIFSKGVFEKLQQMLQQSGQYIPTKQLNQPTDLIGKAKLVPSSTMALGELPPCNDGRRYLEMNCAMLLPFEKGKVPQFVFEVLATENSTFEAEFYVSSKPGNFTPDVVLASRKIPVQKGSQSVTVDFELELDEPRYGFVTLKQNLALSVPQSDFRMTGVLSVFYRGTQQQNDKLGIEEIPFFTPGRRPMGKSMACRISPPLAGFGIEQMRRGIFRPAADAANAWVALHSDQSPKLEAHWPSPQTIRRIVLWFDTDFDHPMESCLYGHPEDAVPFCVKQFRIKDDQGRVVHETSDNHHSHYEIRLDSPIKTSSLTLELHAPNAETPVSLLGWQAFE